MAKQAAIESPPVNIYEAPNELTVAVPIPGAHDDTVKVELQGQQLSIDAEPRYPQEQQHYLQHEWSVGAWHREVKLSRPVRAAGAKAILTHGVLTISFPLGGEGSSERIRIPVAEPQIHQGQAH